MDKKQIAKNVLILQKLGLISLGAGLLIFIVCAFIFRPWKYNGLKTSQSYVTSTYDISYHEVVPDDFFKYCDDEVTYNPYRLGMVSERRNYLINKSFRYSLYGIAIISIGGLIFLYAVPAQKRLIEYSKE